MAIWLIEPHDPLIVRDGRPFGPNPGARATSLSFPFPSTTTGGVRTRVGQNADGIFDLASNQLAQLRQLSVRGPLLVQLTPDGNDIAPNKWLVPAPFDALLFPAETLAPSREKIVRVQQLVPLMLPEGAQTDFDHEKPEGMQIRFEHEKFMLVGMPQPDLSKPLKKSPCYWTWESFQIWLLNPSHYNGNTVSLAMLAQSGPLCERRIHVSIDADREVAKDGMLFETSGLEFTSPGKGEQRLKDAQRLALAVAVDDNNSFVRQLQDGLTCLGGERRMVSWRKSSADLPSCLTELEQAIVEKKACRVILLTPACFKKGYCPTQLLTEQYGVTPKLKAIATQRPQVVSGWDLDLKQPKPSRRLAPAGTVLFLTLEGSDATIRNWVRGMWMQCISDESQDRTDGFGLVVLGTWSGQPEAMQKGQQL